MIKRYLKILITLIISMIIITSPCISKAVEETEGGGSSEENVQVTVETARNKLVEWSIAFANKNASQCIYPSKSRGYTFNQLCYLRGATYRGVYPNSQDNHYYFDCYGWVSFAIHNALNLDCDEARTGNSGFVRTETVAEDARKYFKRLKDMGIPLTQIEAGDILQCNVNKDTQHVAIYIGNNQVVDMWEEGLAIRNIYRSGDSWRMSKWEECKITGVSRLMSVDGVHFGALPDGVDVTGGGSPEFQYSGMPLTVSVSGDYSLGYYVQKIGELYDYMIGIMFNAIKSIPIMIADGIQGIITDALNFLNGNGETSG